LDRRTDEEAIFACIHAAGKENNMEKKTFRAAIELKEDDGEEGTFQAVFSRLNVIDYDGDITLPGAFTNGQKVRISYWGHRWQDLPVGRGEIHADNEKAWVDGKFFLDTTPGLETYKTVKNLAELQEWSYGFDILEAENGEKDGKYVRYLKSLKVHEVAPVFLGAGIGTETTAIKSNKGQKSDIIENNEDQTGNGESSGVSPTVILVQLELLEDGE